VAGDEVSRWMAEPEQFYAGSTRRRLRVMVEIESTPTIVPECRRFLADVLRGRGFTAVFVAPWALLCRRLLISRRHRATAAILSNSSAAATVRSSDSSASATTSPTVTSCAPATNAAAT